MAGKSKSKRKSRESRDTKTAKVLVRLTPELHARALRAVDTARKVWKDDGGADTTLAGVLRESITDFCRRVESADMERSK